MEENVGIGEEPKKEKQKKNIEDRRYWAANIVLLLFLLVVGQITLIAHALGWPPSKSARITVENNTGKPCYVAILSTDTDNYGRFGKNLHIVDSEEYWGAVKDVCIAGGMSEEDAEQYARAKKQELRFKDEEDPSVIKYSFEMYRELVKAFFTRLSDETGHIAGKILYHGLLEGDIDAYPPYEDWKGIAAYGDSDGYLYIHQEAKMLSSGAQVSQEYEVKEWGLPEQFKILLYWPEDGRYAVSGVCKNDHVLSEYLIKAETMPDDVASLQAVDQSKSETVPWWMALAALVLFLGCELLIARLCGASKKQLSVMAVVSGVLHAALVVIMILSRQAIMVDGGLRVNQMFALLALCVVIPVVEMPIYVRFLREKGKYAFEWYKYCEFTLFINWVVPVIALAIRVALLFPSLV